MLVFYEFDNEAASDVVRSGHGPLAGFTPPYQFHAGRASPLTMPIGYSRP